MDEEVKKAIDRAKWIYAFNGGAVEKIDCAKQAVMEQGVASLKWVISLFEIRIDEYIKYIASQV